MPAPQAAGRWASPGGVSLLLFENCSRNKGGGSAGFPLPALGRLRSRFPSCLGRWGSVRAERPEFSPRLVLLSPSAPRSPCPRGLGEAVGSVCHGPRLLLGLSLPKHCPTCSARNLSKGLSSIRAQALLPLFIYLFILIALKVL